MPSAATSQSSVKLPAKLDDPFRQAHPEIPWSGLIGARNIVMHAYEYLRPDLIREMAEKDVPELLAHCLHLLGETGPQIGQPDAR
jgi:uncharacterized protein with HEPN domain